MTCESSLLVGAGEEIPCKHEYGPDGAHKGVLHARRFWRDLNVAVNTTATVAW
jgi:hypothetical protein